MATKKKRLSCRRGTVLHDDTNYLLNSIQMPVKAFIVISFKEFKKAVINYFFFIIRIDTAEEESANNWFRSLKSVFPSTVIVTVSSLLIFVGSILYSHSSSSKSSTDIFNNKSPTVSTTLTSDVVSDGSTLSQYFMIKRVGYENIDYFDESIPSNFFKYKFLEKYVSIIEPYVDMELKMYDMYKSSMNTFQFEVCPKSKQSGTTIESKCQSGSRFYNATTSKPSSSHINFGCSPFDAFSITVKEVSYVDGSTVLSTFNGDLLCSYIRRELRSLTSTDLSTLVQTMYKVWTTTETEGVALYGNNFHNITYLLRFHHFNAADRKTDHIHNGNGILMQHTKFENIFEKSLQAIEPSLALVHTVHIYTTYIHIYIFTHMYIYT